MYCTTCTTTTLLHHDVAVITQLNKSNESPVCCGHLLLCGCYQRRINPPKAGRGHATLVHPV